MRRVAHLIQRGLRSGTRYRALPNARWDALYPLDCTAFGEQEPDGTLLVRRPVDGGTEFLHPVATCFRVLARLQIDDGLTERNRAAVATAVHALLETQQDDGSWRYPVPVARYGVKPGWSSAMAQGLAASTLIRCAHALPASESDAVRTRVDAAIAHLLLAVDDGGCSSYNADGAPFPEECPALPSPYILNGACFSLLGVADYERIAGGDIAAAMARRLNELLPRWDIGYYSRYDLLSAAPCSPDYHRLHVVLLRILGEMYGLEFGSYADRFHEYERRLASRLRARLVLAADRLLITRS